MSKWNLFEVKLRQQKSQVVLRLPKTSEEGDLRLQRVAQHLEKLDTKNKAIIIPPEVLDKTYEVIGKSLLKAQQKLQRTSFQEKDKNATTTSEEALKSTESTETVSKVS